MLQRHHAVAGIAVEAERGELAGLRIHGRGMAAGAAVGELLVVPAALLQDGELAIPCALQFAHVLTAAKEKFLRRIFLLPHGARVMVLLPAGANIVAMAEEAFIAMYKLR